jgi:hypothetical protein
VAQFYGAGNTVGYPYVWYGGGGETDIPYVSCATHKLKIPRTRVSSTMKCILLYRQAEVLDVTWAVTDNAYRLEMR